MNKLKITDLQRIAKALHCSLNGITTAWKNEAAFGQESICAIILIPLALWLGESAVERAFLIFVVLLVLLIEMINSAIEAVVDRFGGEQHALSGNAKDMGSAAVLIAIVMAAVVWALILSDQ